MAALRQALHQRRSGVAACTFPGAPEGIWVGQVPGLEAAAPPAELASFDCRNNRIAELALRSDDFAEAVARAVARDGAERVAVVAGTSTAGVEETERAYARRAAGTTELPTDYSFADTHDLQALPRYLQARLGLRGPGIVVSTACTSGARAMMEAAALIAAGIVDAAVAGGVDSLCRLTLHGFASLELLSRGPCRPCAGDRDGIAIGEAGGLLLLERPTAAPEGAMLLLGAGASSDGHHMSSPQPDGLGAVGAMRAALSAAGLGAAEIDYVNLHGTGTRANDAMEDRAVHHLFGDAVPCSSTKGWTGHTLGASGAVEAGIAAICIEDGLVPGCLNVETPDPEFRSQVVAGSNRAARLRRVLSNSFGFGGSNCALVLGRAA
jgi:3-oxoacyl-[acyl-carrier-protein] synthase-1